MELVRIGLAFLSGACVCATVALLVLGKMRKALITAVSGWSYATQGWEAATKRTVSVIGLLDQSQVIIKELMAARMEIMVEVDPDVQGSN